MTRTKDDVKKETEKETRRYESQRWTRTARAGDGGALIESDTTEASRENKVDYFLPPLGTGAGHECCMPLVGQTTWMPIWIGEDAGDRRRLGEGGFEGHAGRLGGSTASAGTARRRSWDDIKQKSFGDLVFGARRERIVFRASRGVWKEVDHSLIMFTWVALKDNVKKTKILWTITGPCLNREFPREEMKNFHTLRIFVFLHGLMISKVMRRNVWSDIVS